MAVMETLHNTVPEESRIYVVFVLVILWDVRLNAGAKLIEGDASVMTVCIVYGVLWQVSKMVSAFVEVGIAHNKNRVEIKHSVIFLFIEIFFFLFNVCICKIDGFLLKNLKTSIICNGKNKSYKCKHNN